MCEQHVHSNGLFNCRCAAQFVTVFLQCLDHKNQDVVDTALKNLAEFVLLAQGIDFLKIMFLHSNQACFVLGLLLQPSMHSSYQEFSQAAVIAL